MPKSQVYSRYTMETIKQYLPPLKLITLYSVIPRNNFIIKTFFLLEISIKKKKDNVYRRIQTTAHNHPKHHTGVKTSSDIPETPRTHLHHVAFCTQGR